MQSKLERNKQWEWGQRDLPNESGTKSLLMKLSPTGKATEVIQAVAASGREC